MNENIQKDLLPKDQNNTNDTKDEILLINF